MSFDFTADSIEFVIEPEAAAISPAPPFPLPAGAVELAVLVCELFAEGTLSWDQLRSMAHLPELGGALAPLAAAVPAARRR